MRSAAIYNIVLIYNVLRCTAIRKGVIVAGTTTGPDFHPSTGKYSPFCPDHHPWKINHGKHCCKTYENAADSSQPLDEQSPSNICKDAIECPDPTKSGHPCKPGSKVAAICPDDKPFPLNGGKQCCKYYRRSNNTSFGCDWDFLTLEDPAECCYKDEITICPGKTGVCSQHPNATGFCPDQPALGRAGDHAVNVLVTSTSKLWSYANTTCSGMLPMLKEPGDLDALVNFIKAQYPDLTYIAFSLGLVKNPAFNDPAPPYCSGVDCEGRFQWRDGTPFLYRSWMANTFNISLYPIAKYGCSQFSRTALQGSKITPMNCLGENASGVVCSSSDPCQS